MYRRFAHPLVRPLLAALLSGITEQVNGMPRPTDAPHAHASGADPDRLLLVGSGPAIGYGVLSHDLALPGQLARIISAATGRGTDVDLSANPDVVIQNADAILEQREIWRYDGVVLALGTNNALLFTSPGTWRRELQQLVDRLLEQLPDDAGVYLLGIAPLAAFEVDGGTIGALSARHAAKLDAESRRIAMRTGRVTFIPFSPLVVADFTRYRSAATYQQWASVMAAPIIADLERAHRGDAVTTRVADEDARQLAVEALGVLDTRAEERFTRIATLSSQLLGVDQTLILFVDHDRFWIKAASDPGLVAVDTLPRAGTLFDLGLYAQSPVVVEDALLDSRVARHEAVRGEPGVRFIAVHPIESAFGVRIGVVAALSREVRAWTPSESTLLRDLALMVQRELSTPER